MDATPEPYRNIAVIGAGSIGVAFAIVFARAGLSVALHDANAERLTVALDSAIPGVDAATAVTTNGNPPVF